MRSDTPVFAPAKLKFRFAEIPVRRHFNHLGSYQYEIFSEFRGNTIIAFASLGRATTSSSCVDTSPLNDGWGWNYSTESSCRTDEIVEIINNETPVVVQSTGGFCEDTPPLNNGWGWNNTRRESCQLPTTTTIEPGHFLIFPNSANQTPTVVDIPYVSSAPVIDGYVDLGGEWAGATSQDQWGQNTYIDNLLVKNKEGYEDYEPLSKWYAMHDGNYLYLLIKNTEDQTVSEERLDSSRHYQDDSVEIFLDGNASRFSSYDGYDDYQLILKYLPGSEEWGNEGSLRNLDYEYATNYYQHSTGDVYYEIAINLNSAGIYYSYNEFGIDIQINEDDDGGDRDAKWAWAGRSGEDISWQNPSAFGRARLTY